MAFVLKKISGHFCLGKPIFKLDTFFSIIVIVGNGMIEFKFETRLYISLDDNALG